MIHPATFTTLASVLKTAVSGDTVTLTGEFKAISVQGKEGVILDARAAKVGSLLLKACHGVSVIGGTFRPAPSAWLGGIYAQGCDGVSLEAPKVLGDGTSPGITCRNSRGLSLAGGYIQQARVGINILESQDVHVTDTGVYGSAIDGMDIAASQDVLVELNCFAGGLLADLHHPDAIQMWSIADKPQTARVTIRKNAFHGYSQGSSMFNHYELTGDQIVIEDNWYALGYPQAIALNSVTASAVRRNHVHTLAGAKWRASINIPPEVERAGNVVEPGAGKPGLVD